MSNLSMLFQLNESENWKSILLEKLDIKFNPEIEIEARLGTIIDKKSRERINIPTNQIVLFDSNKNESNSFISGVKIKDYEYIKEKFKNLQSISVKDKVVIDGKIRNIYIKNELHECMSKEKLRSFDLYCPNFLYDIRLSISRERKTEFKASSTLHKYVRERERETFKAGSYKFEFTAVKNENSYINHEVEVEVENENYDKNEFLNVIINLQNDQN
ncbi:mRNA-capping enzyme subunit beta [Gurleya vavrai]